jgi:WD40 repeat protein
VAFSPDGKTLASGAQVLTKTEDRKAQALGELKLWDVATGEEKNVLSVSGAFIYAVAFSPDGKTLAGAGGAHPASLDTNQYWDFKDIPKKYFDAKEFGDVRVWDLATLKERTFYRGDTGEVKSVAFSPDSKTLAAGVRDGAIRLWDVSTGKESACLKENAHGVRAVAFSPDGKTLASVQFAPDDPVKLWDLASGRVRARLKEGAGWVCAVAFSPDGKTLALASCVPSRDPKRTDVTGEVLLCDAVTGRPVGKPLTFPHSGSSVAFDARGKVLAVAGTQDVKGGPGKITLWNLSP